MQLGLTIPLQKFLKLPKPLYGDPSDLHFCWELHKVPRINESTLIAVNASSRYALVFAPMQAADWKRLEEIVTDGIMQALAQEGYGVDQAEAYLALAGDAHLTKTHGRKPVAGLNHAVCLLQWTCSDMHLDRHQLFQPAISAVLNEELCSAAGFPDAGHGYPKDFLKEDMARFNIEVAD